MARASMPSSSIRYRMTPGSRLPQRVPIGRPSTAVKPIVLATLRPPTIAHMLLPLPRCATTVRPDGGLRIELRQHAGDVLVGQAMKAVAPHAALGDRGRQREGLRHLGLRAMERGVEAGHLRQLRAQLRDDLDRLEVVRLMQRRQRAQLLERGDHLGRRPARLA